LDGVWAMNQGERDRLMTIRAASEGRMNQPEAAARLNVTTRQVRRLVERYKESGDGVAVHGLKGIAGNRGRGREEDRDAVLFHFLDEYGDYGPVLLSETLLERHELKVPRETLRRWLAKDGLRESGRSSRRRHPRRERRSRRGELVQLDTSIHAWFEGRGAGGEEPVLIVGIDDATSEAYGRFFEGDTSRANQEVIRRWTERNGRAGAFYFDRAAHFAGKPDEDGGDTREQTQVGRMLLELDIEPILANSPQAKGRVERTFKTHQDRLVKKLRERRISTIEAANDFLEREYWTKHNLQFAKPPLDPIDAHRALTNEQRRRFREICAIRVERTLLSGELVKVDGRALLVEIGGRRGPREGAKIVVVSERPGEIRLVYDGRNLRFEDITEREPARTEQRRRVTLERDRRERLLAECRRKDVQPSGRLAGRSIDSLSVLELQALRPPPTPTGRQRFELHPKPWARP
jgi:hypothetical protein